MVCCANYLINEFLAGYIIVFLMQQFLVGIASYGFVLLPLVKPPCKQALSFLHNTFP